MRYSRRNCSVKSAEIEGEKLSRSHRYLRRTEPTSSLKTPISEKLRIGHGSNRVWRSSVDLHASEREPNVLSGNFSGLCGILRDHPGTNKHRTSLARHANLYSRLGSYRFE